MTKEYNVNFYFIIFRNKNNSNFVSKKNIGQSYFEEASILHSLISHSDFLYDHNWSLNDFRDYIRLLPEIGEFDSDEMCEKVLYQLIYASKMNNNIDTYYVKKLIHQVIIEKVKNIYYPLKI